MKVFHFCYNANELSGASMQAINLCKQLTKNTEVKCKIFNLQKTGKPSVSSINSSITLHTLPVNKIYQIVCIVFHLIRFRPQIVHCHGFTLHVILLAKLLGIKVFVKSTLLDDDDFDTLTSPRVSFFRRICNKIAIRAIDVNNSLTTPIYEINRRHISKGVVKISNMYSRKISECDAKLNQALIVGAVVPRKDVIGAINFYQEHLAMFIDKLVIVGPLRPKSSEYCPSYSEEVMSLIESHDNIEFIGQVSQSEVAEYMKKSRLIILASFSEGMPNVVIEALANNCFVFTRDLNGVAAQMFDSSCGRLISDTYKEDLEEIIANSIVAKAPQRFALEHFGAESIARQYLEVYTKLVT